MARLALVRCWRCARSLVMLWHRRPAAQLRLAAARGAPHGDALQRRHAGDAGAGAAGGRGPGGVVGGATAGAGRRVGCMRAARSSNSCWSHGPASTRVLRCRTCRWRQPTLNASASSSPSPLGGVMVATLSAAAPAAARAGPACPARNPAARNAAAAAAAAPAGDAAQRLGERALAPAVAARRRPHRPARSPIVDDLRRLPFTVKTDLRDNYPSASSPARCSSWRGCTPVGHHRQADRGGLHRAGSVHLVRPGGALAALRRRAPRRPVHNAYGYGLFTGGLGARTTAPGGWAARWCRSPAAAPSARWR